MAMKITLLSSVDFSVTHFWHAIPAMLLFVKKSRTNLLLWQQHQLAYVWPDWWRSLVQFLLDVLKDFENDARVLFASEIMGYLPPAQLVYLGLEAKVKATLFIDVSYINVIPRFV